MNIEGLLIDIDDTLIRFRQGVNNDTASLLNVLKQAGQQFSGLTPEEVEHRITWVKKNVNWWCWDDFIKKLELEEAFFWDYAYNVERKYLEPSEPDLVESFKFFKSIGLKLFITSNNPNKGIQHKLRLANIPTEAQSILFSNLFGATEMQDMKWETNYWRKIIFHSGIRAENLAVIGDSFRDDYQIPQAVGIAMTFLIDINQEYTSKISSALQPVSGIAQIARLFQKERAVACNN